RCRRALRRQSGDCAAHGSRGVLSRRAKEHSEMKRCVLFLVSGFVAIAALAQSSPEEHSAHHPPSTNAAQTTASPSMDMHQNMKAMQLLMDKIENTSNPAERKRLLEQHGKAMREQLQSMQHMDDGAGMGM